MTTLEREFTRFSKIQVNIHSKVVAFDLFTHFYDLFLLIVVGSLSQVRLEDLPSHLQRRCEKAWLVDPDYRSVKYLTHDATLVGIEFLP